MEQPFDSQTTEYARYRALGYSQIKAAQEVGFSRHTGQRREQLPGFEALVADFRRQFREEEEGPLSLLVPVAWRVLGRALAENDVETAKYIIDRRYGKAQQSTNITGSVNVELGDAANRFDQLLSRLIAARGPAGDSDSQAVGGAD